MKTLLLRLRALTALLLTGSVLGLSGCDWDNSDDHENYSPPEGQGALRVVNNTGDDIRVYVNGEQQGTTGDYSDRVFNVEPGVFRVVLDQKGGDRNYRDDIDIVEGRLTVLDVVYDSDPYDNDYDVNVYFD